MFRPLVRNLTFASTLDLDEHKVEGNGGLLSVNVILPYSGCLFLFISVLYRGTIVTSLRT